jgi:hypothetical protein
VGAVARGLGVGAVAGVFFAQAFTRFTFFTWPRGQEPLRQGPAFFGAGFTSFTFFTCTPSPPECRISRGTLHFVHFVHSGPGEGGEEREGSFGEVLRSGGEGAQVKKVNEVKPAPKSLGHPRGGSGLHGPGEESEAGEGLREEAREPAS